eukprot:CAMPEP_0117442060 /NCGR_PEP_ID=MMETSP0759-20121206/3953_1 /TAXON_ID=63605 /ORGANISM="Percolomonas cosmopolitus, Strain WS" /LENGTH=333 /DNA_ID=CAMNT_0005233929 /DNA_START=98 /DNA_END=1099 /DNA_ORIENTATION=+
MASAATHKSTEALLGRIEKSLGHALDYMEQNIGKMPLDATFGLNAAQWVLTRKHPLGERAHKLTQRDVRQQRKNHPNYYSQFHLLLDEWQSWSPANPVQRFLNSHPPHTHASNQLLSPLPKEKCSFKESISDSCLTEAIHCKLSDRCAHYETTSSTKSAYCLTHQMLYYEFLRRFCSNQSTKSHAVNALKLLSLELLTEVDKVSGTETWTDQWVERYLLGAVVGGYDKFVRPHVLDYMMERQTSLGCWKGDEPNIRFDSKATRAPFSTAADATHLNMDNIFETLPANPDTTTDDDEDRTLIDYDSGSECAYHTTGLAIYYLSVSYTYLSVTLA